MVGSGRAVGVGAGVGLEGRVVEWGEGAGGGAVRCVRGRMSLVFGEEPPLRVVQRAVSHSLRNCDVSKRVAEFFCPREGQDTHLSQACPFS